MGGFHAAFFGAGFVDVEVAVVEGGDAEEFEVEVGSGVEGVGEFLDVVFIEDVLGDAFDFDAVEEVGLEVILVGLFEGLDAVGLDVPGEDFFVDVGEEDAAGEFGHVGVFFEEGLGVEDDGFFEVLGGDFGADGAAEFFFDVFLGDGNIESDEAELDALFELGTVPEGGGAIGMGNDDHGFLSGVFGLDGVFFAEAGAFVTVADVVGGDFEEALAHEFFLDEVLHVLDVDEGGFAGANTGGDGLGDGGGSDGLVADGEEGAGDGVFDFGLGPGDDVSVPADEADGHFVGGVFVDGDFAGVFEGALEDEGFGNVVGVVFDEGFFNEEVEIVLGELEGAASLDLVHEGGGDAVGDAGDEGTISLGEDLVFGLLSGDEEVGERAADGISDVGEGEDFLEAGTGDGDFRDGGAVLGGEGFTPGVSGWAFGGETGGDGFFEGEVFG